MAHETYWEEIGEEHYKADVYRRPYSSAWELIAPEAVLKEHREANEAYHRGWKRAEKKRKTVRKVARCRVHAFHCPPSCRGRG